MPRKKPSNDLISKFLSLYGKEPTDNELEQYIKSERKRSSLGFYEMQLAREYNKNAGVKWWT